MRILFAVSSWGLGHATRDLVLIRALLAAGHQMTIISTERALQLLQGELGDSCAFLDVPDIPKPLGRKRISFYVKMTFCLPLVFWTFWREHQLVGQLLRTSRFDRVVSDGRYGVSTAMVPSFYVLHTLRQTLPGRFRLAEVVIEAIQQRLFSQARKVIVPDQEEKGLAGDLCHNLDCFRREQLEYIGILSSLRRNPVEPDVDYFISVSGAEPQRTILEKKVLEQAHDLSGRVVIALGRPDLPPTVSRNGRVAVHSFMNRCQQEEMMNRARLVISRSGYTTLMELAELGKRALVIPSVGQNEQEYLAAYHEALGTVHGVDQSRLDLARDAAVAERYPGIPLSHGTRDSARRFLELLEA